MIIVQNDLHPYLCIILRVSTENLLPLIFPYVVSKLRDLLQSFSNELSLETLRCLQRCNG